MTVDCVCDGGFLEWVSAWTCSRSCWPCTRGASGAGGVAVIRAGSVLAFCRGFTVRSVAARAVCLESSRWDSGRMANACATGTGEKRERSTAMCSACPTNRSPSGRIHVASRSASTLFLHVVNTSRTDSATARLSLPDAVAIGTAAAYQIVDDPMVEVSELNSSEVMQIRETTLSSDGKWSFPAASVTAVEVQLAA